MLHRILFHPYRNRPCAVVPITRSGRISTIGNVGVGSLQQERHHDQHQPMCKQSCHWFSSYDYPNRTEAPIISRTKASDVSSPSSSLDPTSVILMPSKNIKYDEDDPFDDHNILSKEQVHVIRLQQKSHLNTKLSSPNILSRVTAQAPSISYTLSSSSSSPASSLRTAPQTQVTTLPNGIRVASQETYGQVSTLGVLANACGSRYEQEDTMGVNHLMQLLAFSGIQKNHNTMDAGQFLSTMDSLGAITFASSSLEQFLYCVDVLRPHSQRAFELLSDSILYPNLNPEVLYEGKRTIEYQWMDSLVSPEVRMEEGIRYAAFGTSTDNNKSGRMHVQQQQQLARPHFCPLHALPHLTLDTIQQFRTQHLLNPNHLVVAGAGIEHELLVSWVNQFFGHLQSLDTHPPTASSSSSSSSSSSFMIPSTYTGGSTHLLLHPTHFSTSHVYPHPHHHDSSITPPPAASSSLMQDTFTRVALSFPTGGWYHTTDLVPACVLQTLLGGGNSFSAGGPGKGMYSRLYREILNRYYWAESAEAFTFFYQEYGLIGMSGSCSTPDKAKDLTRVLTEHFLKLLTTPVSDEELSRARNMLKCNVLTQLESRLVLFEDIARQIGTYGKRETSTDMCTKIDSVSKEDIQRVIKTAIEGNRPTLCAMGESTEKIIPTLEEVETWFR